MITLPDLVNGIYESFGGAFIALSIIKLHQEKVVRGVSWLHVAFFSSWGVWNLYFYPHLDQWFSFWGGVILVATNFVWLGQIVWYNWVRRLEGLIQNRWRADAEAPGTYRGPTGRYAGPDRRVQGKPTERFRHSDK